MKVMYEYVVSVELDGTDTPEEEVLKALEEHLVEFTTELNTTECSIRPY